MMEPTGSATVNDVVERLVGHVDALLDDAFDRLQPIVSATLATLRTDHADLAAALREALERPCRDSLAAPGQAAFCGAGFAAEPGRVLHGQPWMVWWVDRDGVVQEKQHNLNPVSDAFYDYSEAPWFTAARDHGTNSLVGPFIDSWGTDDFTITASTPVQLHGQFQGVAAADLTVRRLETALSRRLRDVGAPAVLVNQEDRVVASGVPALTTGLPLSPRAGSGDAAPERARFGCGHGWSIVLLAS